MKKITCRKEEEYYLVYNRELDIIKKYKNYEDIKKEWKYYDIRKVCNKKTNNSYSFPFKLFFDLNNFCNLNCIHCLSESSPNNKGFIDKNIAFKAIDECFDNGIFRIKLGGGEPLLHPDFWDIVKYIYEKSTNIRISFTTNGVKISDKDIKNIKKYNCSISVSLDGNREVHNLIRNNDIYNKVIQNIQILLDNNIKPDIRFTLLDLNKNVVMAVYKYCIEKGLKLKIRRYKPFTSDTQLLLTYDKELFNLIDQLNKLENCDLDNIFQNKVKNNCIYNVFDCGAAYRSIHIDCYGNITPCVFLGKEYISGNIYKDSIKNIWDTSKEFYQIRENSKNIKCSTCVRNYICHNECLAVKKFYSNDICGFDPACTIKRGN